MGWSMKDSRRGIINGDTIVINGEHGRVLGTKGDWIRVKFGNKEKIIRSAFCKVVKNDYERDDKRRT